MGTTIRVAPLAAPLAEAAVEEDAPLPLPEVRDVAPALEGVPLITTPATRVPASELRTLSPSGSTDFSVFTNTTLPIPMSQRSNQAPETSLGKNGQVVFTTGNWYAALSTDAEQMTCPPITGPV